MVEVRFNALGMELLRESPSSIEGWSEVKPFAEKIARRVRRFVLPHSRYHEPCSVPGSDTVADGAVHRQVRAATPERVPP